MNFPPDSPLNVLLPYQRDWYADKSRFKAGLWGRQEGKDFTNGAESVADCLQRPKTMWMIAAPSERQAIESLSKAKEWAEAFKVALADEQYERDHPGALLKSGSIEFPNGSRILAVPGRPDTVRGFSANVILTEFAFFDDPDATWRAVLPSITNPLRGGVKCVRIISTPNGQAGRGRKFYEIIRDNLLEPKEGRKMKWSVHKVTIEDAVRVGLNVDIEEIKEALNSPEGFLQEYMVEFVDGSDCLLPYDLIEWAESFDCSVTCEDSFFEDTSRTLYCGVDFGRVNDPTVCVTLEEFLGVLWTREVLILRGMSSPLQQQILSRRIRAAQRTCFDYTGPGIGLGDYLVAEHGQFDANNPDLGGKVELCTFTVGFKRLLFPRLRSAFGPLVAGKPELGTRLRIPYNIDLREDLHAMNQVIKNGEYFYNAPRTADGHSDQCTAYGLGIRASELGGTATGYSTAIPALGGRRNFWERDRQSGLYTPRRGLL